MGCPDSRDTVLEDQVSQSSYTSSTPLLWAGLSLREKSWPEHVDIKKEKEMILKALTSSGVNHNDIRKSNLVWNPERRRVTAIDFDQATITSVSKRKAETTPHPARKQSMGNKRRKTAASSCVGSRAITV